MDTRSTALRPGPTIVGAAAVLGVLFYARLHNYPFFHTIGELFAISVAAATFMVMWNSRRFSENGYLLFLGIALLYIATIDLLHTLAYKGVAVFPGYTNDLPTQLWIAGRYLQALSFLIAPWFLTRKVNARLQFALYTGVTALLIASVFWWDVFPSAFDEATGLTAFKMVSEYVIIALFLAAGMALYRKREQLAPGVARLILWSIGVTMLSEFFFTLYGDPWDTFNLLGHAARIFAFYLLYRAVVVATLLEPYATLFRELTLNADALVASEARLHRAKELSDALNAIDTAINSTLEFDEIMRRVIVEATKAIGSDSAAIEIREGDRWVVRYVHRLPDEKLGLRFSKDTGRHLALAAETRAPVIVNDAVDDERVHPGFVQTYNIKSLVTVPLLTKDSAIGGLTFHYLTRPVTITDEQVDFANRLALSIALAIENARLFDAQRVIADTLQSSMLTMPSRLPGIEIGHVYRSATELARIGGDFYDAFELGDGRLGLVIGDVSGKGIEAATLTNVARTTIRAFAVKEKRPAVVMASVNDVLSRFLGDGRFVTATYGMLDIDTGRILLASAGHPDPYVCRPGSCLIRNARRNAPLGLFEGTAFEEYDVVLEPGDTLVMFSDGLLDTRHGPEFFGDQRADAVIQQASANPPQQLVEELMRAVMTFASQDHSDDIAIVAVRYAPEPRL